MKSFATEKGAKAAVRKQGLDLMPHRFEQTAEGRVAVIFQWELPEDRDELLARGFGAERLQWEGKNGYDK